MQQKQMTSARLAASFVHLPQKQSGNEQLSNDLRSERAEIRSLNRSKEFSCVPLFPSFVLF